MKPLIRTLVALTILNTLIACSSPSINPTDTSAAPVGPDVTGNFKGIGTARGQILGGLPVGPAQITGDINLLESSGVVAGSVKAASSLGGKNTYSVLGRHYGTSLNIKLNLNPCSGDISFTGAIQGDVIVFQAGSGVISCQFGASGTITWDSFTVNRQP